MTTVLKRVRLDEHRIELREVLGPGDEEGLGQRWVIDTRPDPLLRDDAWVTADGTEMPIGEMRDSHIFFVIRFLRRRARSLHHGHVQQMIQDSVGPFAPRGDWACDAFDREFDRLLDADPREWIEGTPIVRALKAELVRRHEPWGVA